MNKCSFDGVVLFIYVLNEWGNICPDRSKYIVVGDNFEQPSRSIKHSQAMQGNAFMSRVAEFSL